MGTIYSVENPKMYKLTKQSIALMEKRIAEDRIAEDFKHVAAEIIREEKVLSITLASLMG